MKKILLSVLIIISFLTCLFGQEVDRETIRTVALTASRAYNPLLEESIKITNLVPISEKEPGIGYIVNISDSSFVIVSGDYSIKPILGHSNNGPFTWDNIPTGLQYLLSKYEAGIKYSRDHNLDPTIKTKERWQTLKNNNVSYISTKSSVGPLLNTEWSQGPNYNYYCPEDEESIYSNDKCPAGCSAVACAQI